jgi:Domain of unknown function (DUF4157)
MGDQLVQRRRGVIAAGQQLERTVPAQVRRKLSVGAEDDPAEREADLVADQVLSRLGDQQTTAPVRTAGSDRLRRSSLGRIARSSVEVGAEGGDLSNETASVLQSARGGGSALPERLGGRLQDAFGADFSGVRVHDDERSHELNRSMRAQAFTAGSDIFLGAEAPSIESTGGTHLLAHELTHVVQNGGGARRSMLPGVAIGIGADGTKIRRMPTSAGVKERTGKKSKSGIKILGGKGATTHYNALLNALDVYRKFIESTKIGSNPGETRSQLQMINTRLDSIDKACDDYMAKSDPDPAVVEEIQNIKKQMGPERFDAERIAIKFGKQAPNRLTGNPSWLLELSIGRTRRDKEMEVKDVEGGEGNKGAQKSVSKVTNSEGKTGYFAKDDQSGKYDEMETDQNSFNYGNKKADGAIGMLGNYGNKDQDLRLAKRSVAMSRVSQLLNAGVIAKTEFAFKNGQYGTFMEEATGETGFAASMNRPGIKDDPNLARLLSRLHLVDLLCGQVDRHDENYYIQFDKSGNVIGVTGIDLDMSFVEESGKNKVSVEKGSHDKSGVTDRLPGLAMFADKALAERIIALDPKDLRAILEDLLTVSQIEAALKRLDDLQKALTKMKSEGKLLDEKQWGQAQRQGLRDEHDLRVDKQFKAERNATGGSYFGRVTK